MVGTGVHRLPTAEEDGEGVVVEGLGGPVGREKGAEDDRAAEGGGDLGALKVGGARVPDISMYIGIFKIIEMMGLTADPEEISGGV